jgi:hypothetical protein
MNNIAKNFDEQFFSEETMKIARENAIAVQQLMTMTEEAISKKNAELAETFMAEISNSRLA